MKKHKNTKIHFTGIAGTAMASLARAFQVAGFRVKGSEPHEIFPPMSDYLQKNKIKYYIGFDPQKVGSVDELVIANAHYADDNLEVVYARQNHIELEHFPRLVEKYLIKKNSVVIAGTYGKTTITSILAWILDKAGKNPNYMLGGIPLNFQHGARLSASSWSVVEGDEYPAASPWDFSPKFKYYHPKYLVLTSAEWDHMDIYKTKASYIKVFQELVKSVPQNGLIIAKQDGENIKQVLKQAKCRVVYYSLKHGSIERPRQNNSKLPIPSTRDYQLLLDDVKQTNHKILFKLNQIDFETNLIGDFNLENLAAAITLAFELKIPAKIIQSAVKTFRGVKRRLEVRGTTKGITIIDDFAHSPSKARQSAKALTTYFPHSRIFVVFEPNRGGRSTKCLKSYQHVFTGVYKVIIPHLNVYKPRPGVRDVTGPELVKFLKKTHTQIVYQPNEAKIVATLVKALKPGDIVAFLGSRNFDTPIKTILKSI